MCCSGTTAPPSTWWWRIIGRSTVACTAPPSWATDRFKTYFSREPLRSGGGDPPDFLSDLVRRIRPYIRVGQRDREVDLGAVAAERKEAGLVGADGALGALPIFPMP